MPELCVLVCLDLCAAHQQVSLVVLGWCSCSWLSVFSGLSFSIQESQAPDRQTMAEGYMHNVRHSGEQYICRNMCMM